MCGKRHHPRRDLQHAQRRVGRVRGGRVLVESEGRLKGRPFLFIGNIIWAVVNAELYSLYQCAHLFRVKLVA